MNIMVGRRLFTLALLLGMTAGCQKVVETPALASPEPEEMLEALRYDEQGTEVSYGSCPYEGELPTLESFDVANLPEFRSDRDRGSNHHMGNERLDDSVLSLAMQPFQAEVFRCLDIASCYVDDDFAGELDVKLEVASSGKVRAATISASDRLAVDPVIPCAKAALARLEFPSVDGGGTFVEYSMVIE